MTVKKVMSMMDEDFHDPATDVHVMKRHHEITSNPKRLAAAKSHAKNEADKLAKVAEQPAKTVKPMAMPHAKKIKSKQ